MENPEISASQRSTFEDLADVFSQSHPYALAEPMTMTRARPKHSKKRAGSTFEKPVGLSKNKKQKLDEIGNFSCEKNPGDETLDTKVIREGSLILGYVQRIDKRRVFVSFPECLTGIIEANNISDEFSKAFSQKKQDNEKVTLEDQFQNKVYPCKIIHIEREGNGRSVNIYASIKPEDINADLKATSLYVNMVIYASICSKEDNGCVVNTGIKNVRAFMPVEIGFIGQVIPTYVKRVDLSEDRSSANVVLMPLSVLKHELPEVKGENVRLHSILPGAKITADVVEVQQHRLMLKFLDFDVCASLHFNGSDTSKYASMLEVKGTVLWVNPISHVIHIALYDIDLTNFSPDCASVPKYALARNIKFLYTFKKRAYYQVNRRFFGFINVRDLPSVEGGMATSLVHAKRNVEKARVMNLHPLDNLIQMSANPSVIEESVTKPEDVQAGDFFDAVVKKHVKDGMWVTICLGLNGFVHHTFLSDVIHPEYRLMSPEALYPVGKAVRCMVIKSDGKGKVNLTCKKSLLYIDRVLALTSYSDAVQGQCYKGVIVVKTPYLVLVSFFNDVKGMCKCPYVPDLSLIHVGQTVLCKVVKNCGKKLLISLEEINPQPMEQNNDPSHVASVSRDSQPQLIEDKKEIEEKFSNMAITAKLEVAEIQSVKGKQLNVMVKNRKGRVHITELGCKIEGVYPLNEYKKGQKIQVYIFGEYMTKKRNFLNVTHQNLNSFQDCCLSMPPFSSKKEFMSGEEIIGFIKEAHETYAEVWLTTTVKGIIDYLHFSTSPTVGRKLSRELKSGFSMTFKVLETSSEKESEDQTVILSRRDYEQPEVGKTVLGLVQVAYLNSGLIIKLPFDYHGSVDITDLSDVYIPVQKQFDYILKLKYVLCHVLEVDHETKYCKLSLRKSRLYQKVANGEHFSPELELGDLKQGETVKGYVKSSSHSALKVIIGRKLGGKIPLHSCKLAECDKCLSTEDILEMYPPGSVIDVVIEHILGYGKNILFRLSEKNTLESGNPVPRLPRLDVKEDICWEEFECFD